MSNYRHGHAFRSNGKDLRTRTYRSWDMMKRRCNDPFDKNYGGRGITYDPRWEKFEAFLADMGECPPGKSIEREDTNGNYCKPNCKWATQHEQCNNQRRNHRLEFEGRIQTISQWSRELGFARGTIERRLNLLGWSVKEALTIPARPGNNQSLREYGDA